MAPSPVAPNCRGSIPAARRAPCDWGVVPELVFRHRRCATPTHRLDPARYCGRLLERRDAAAAQMACNRSEWLRRTVRARLLSHRGNPPTDRPDQPHARRRHVQVVRPPGGPESDLAGHRLSGIQVPKHDHRRIVPPVRHRSTTRCFAPARACNRSPRHLRRDLSYPCIPPCRRLCLFRLGTRPTEAELRRRSRFGVSRHVPQRGVRDRR